MTHRFLLDFFKGSLGKPHELKVRQWINLHATDVIFSSPSPENLNLQAKKTLIWREETDRYLAFFSSHTIILHSCCFLNIHQSFPNSEDTMKNMNSNLKENKTCTWNNPTALLAPIPHFLLYNINHPAATIFV